MINKEKFELILSTKTFSAFEIKKPINYDDFNEYEQEALHFCDEWISEKKYFTLKTSGSTGIPKEIQISREQMKASVQMTQKALDLHEGDCSFICLNVRYIAGIMMLVRAMEIGLKATLIEPSSLPLKDFSDDITFDFLSFVPLQIQEIIEKTPQKVSILNRAKAIILGGAPISMALEEMLQNIMAPIFHTYGMTETVSHVALRRLNGNKKTVFFTTLDGVLISKDNRNCLVIESPSATEKVVTNDVVELLSEKTFIFLGRIDSVINSGGVKVQAEKVEEEIGRIFYESGLNIRFFIAGLPDKKLGEMVSLFLESKPMAVDFEKNTIEKLTKSQLTKYEYPKQFRYLETFPETPTGKIDKKKAVKSIF